MKILQVIKNFPPAIGGSSQDTYFLCKELVKLGHKVTVVTTSSMNNKDIRGFSTGTPTLIWKSSCQPLPKHELFNGIDVYRFKPMFRFWVYDINPRMLAFLLMHARDFDIIHVHGYMQSESSIVLFIHKLENVPMVLTAHDIITIQRGLISALKKTYDKTLGKLILNACEKVIARTPENVKEYESLSVPKEKIEIIPGGIDFERFASSNKSESLIKELGNPDRIVLFVARLLEYKGAQYVIQAIEDIIQEYPNTKFVFVGEDWGYKHYLTNLAKNLGAHHYCVFTDRISEKRLLDFYATSDVFVFPSIVEGFGLTALESIASGTPVVLANTGGLKYILAEIGGYAIDMSKDVPNQIANHVKKVFADNNIKKQVQKQGEVVRNSYTYERIAEKTLKLYDGLV